MNHNAKSNRARRVRSRLANNPHRPRLSVYRTNSHLWVQIIDDLHSKTLLSATTKSLSQGTKTEQAAALGKETALKALKLKVKAVKFDRGPYKYHGRIKAFADSARENGLHF